MIEVKNICKKYKKHTVLDNVSLEIHSGDCIGIIGANGSGKTTLVSIISGINSADSGEILSDGTVISGAILCQSLNIKYHSYYFNPDTKFSMRCY